MPAQYKVVNLHPTEQWPKLDATRREIKERLGLVKFSLADTIMFLVNQYDLEKDRLKQLQ